MTTQARNGHPAADFDAVARMSVRDALVRAAACQNPGQLADLAQLARSAGDDELAAAAALVASQREWIVPAGSGDGAVA